MPRTRLVLIAITIVEAGFVLLGIGAGIGIRPSLWSFDFPGWLEPPVAHLLAGGSLVALVLAIGGWPPRAPARLGVRAAGGAAALLLLPVLLLPDRSGFLGDFLLRQGAIAARGYDRAFPQGLPLDHLLFGHALPAFIAATGTSLGSASRVAGALAYLALIVVAFSGWRRAGQSPAAALLGVLLVAGTGIAAMFTGFARDTVVLLPLLLALAFALGERVEGDRPLSPAAEWLLLAALGLHRSMLVMLVPWAVATWHARRAPRPGRWKVAALALAAGVLVFASLDLGVFARFDLAHHTAWLAPGRVALVPFLHAEHLADVFAALVLLAPVVLAALLLAFPAADRAGRALDLALVLCWLPMALLTEPQQGVFRDFDVFAPMASTSAFVGARSIFRLAPGEPVWSGRLLRVTAVGGLQSLLAVLLVAASPAATRARVLDKLARSPGSNLVRRTQWLDWLAAEAERSGDRRSAATFAARAAEAIPSQLRWVRAALSAIDAGDPRIAREDFRRILAMDSSSVLAWCGIAGTSAALSDSAEREVALDRLRRLVRDPGRRATAVRFVTGSPEIDPTGAVRAAVEDASTAR